MKTNKMIKSILSVSLFGCFCISCFTKVQNVYALGNGSSAPEVKYNIDIDS